MHVGVMDSVLPQGVEQSLDVGPIPTKLSTLLGLPFRVVRIESRRWSAERGGGEVEDVGRADVREAKHPEIVIRVDDFWNRESL